MKRISKVASLLQDKTPVDISGVTTVEKTISQDGRSVETPPSQLES